MAKIDAYLRKIGEMGGSDLHISAGIPPKIRLHGRLLPLEETPWPDEKVQEYLLEVLDTRRRGIYETRHDLDWAYALEEVARFRVNYHLTERGMGGVFRLIPHEIRSVEELGIPKVVERFCHLRNGLVLCTGPTGSGKSTTLAALVDYINRNFAYHIITIEEPIEYVHHDKKSHITQREVGVDADSFASALRAASRQDPDVILVGELRDLDTIGLAITAAEMGYLVFATLHTNSAAKTVDRIIDVFPESQQNHIRIMLSQALKGVVAQLLLRRKDGKGRVPAIEILFPSLSLSSIIREGTIYKVVSLIEGGRGQGMQMMDDSIMSRLRTGLISAETALLYATEKKRFAPFVRKKTA